MACVLEVAGVDRRIAWATTVKQPDPRTVHAGTDKEFTWVCLECKHPWSARPSEDLGKSQAGYPACERKTAKKLLAALKAIFPKAEYAIETEKKCG